MGQYVTAVVLGIRPMGALKKKLGAILWTDDGDGLLDDDLPGVGRVETGTDINCSVLGIVLKGRGDDDDDVPTLPPVVSVAGIKRDLRSEVKAAERRWNKLAAALRLKGIQVPEPELFLVDVNRA
jgi:hypothetical protein